ncbi:hypothetical protein [Legionella fairfieldensis]|uniref:hypothetical protein n=1 Tax=Legionella fairfieldensis TaxID=45064 RepID=UPI000490E5B5|nr:hypothetical protein [Legionella fairfieldensis]
MQRFFAVFFVWFIFLFSNQIVLAEPWFTGPLLAAAGRTVPNGHTSIEVYNFYTLNLGGYNNHWVRVRRPTSNSIVFNPVFTHGITDKMDIQFSLPDAYNRSHGANAHYIGDTSIALGYQLIEQKESKWQPNLRLSLQEIIPLGHFKNLDPSMNGTDVSGLGSYQTVFALNFQHLLQFNEINYLRTRLVLNYVYAARVDIQGVSVYGGTYRTEGIIRPGNLSSIDLAGELILKQNWVAVMETFIARRDRSHFRGIIGNEPDGTPGTIGHGTIDLITLAPALEYNFNANVGLIGGPWFVVTGRNASKFISYIIALNAYW